MLGPVLFILYVIDLALRLMKSKSLTFADDTKLLKAILTMLCCAILQDDLGRVVKWSIANNMFLHDDKFKVLNYCLNSSLLLRNLPFTAHLLEYVTPKGVAISPTTLGVEILAGTNSDWVGLT